MNKQHIPYGHQDVSNDDIQVVINVLKSDWLTQGPTVREFEDALCNRFGVRYAVAVTSGTAALHLANLALGVGPGDEVITSPNTFVASANCVLYAGGKPRFVDIDERTYNMSANKLEEYMSVPANRTNLRGIIPVHFAGQPCDMERIHALAQQYGLWVLEDAAHAPGARWRDSAGMWQTVGSCSHSDAAVLSFHPVKHITTGEGGAVLTNRQDIYERLISLRSHGIINDPGRMEEQHGPWYYEMTDLGFNYRMTDIQSALGVSQLGKLDGWLERRREIARGYDEAFRDIEAVTTPYISPNAEHAYHLYVLQVPERRAVFERLRAAGIGVQVHYIPVHLQPYYRKHLGYQQGDYPAAEAYYEGCVSIPMFPSLGSNDIEYVIEQVKTAVMEANNAATA